MICPDVFQNAFLRGFFFLGCTTCVLVSKSISCPSILVRRGTAACIAHHQSQVLEADAKASACHMHQPHRCSCSSCVCQFTCSHVVTGYFLRLQTNAFDTIKHCFHRDKNFSQHAGLAISVAMAAPALGGIALSLIVIQFPLSTALVTIPHLLLPFFHYSQTS